MANQPPVSALSDTTAPQPPSTSGSGGVAQVQSNYQKLQALKQQVQSGSLSVVDFNAQADPLIKQTAQLVGTIAGQGKNAANSVNPIWQNIQNDGFVTARGGQWVSTLPFSSQEYAQLPQNVLPSQDDVNKGLFNPSIAPLQRYQTANGGVTNSPATNPVATPVNGPDGNPLPQVNPSLPPGIDTRTDQGQIALQGSQNAAQLQDALNKQLQVNQSAVGQLGQSLAGIPDIYRKEGMSQQQQLQGLADSQKSSRAQALTDLGGILATNQQNLFNRAIPDLAEQANTRGMFQSTGFGNALAQKYANLTADTQTQLAGQGLSDREAYLGAQSNALNTQLGYSGQGAQAQAAGQQTIGAAGAGALQAYGAGLGDVANAQIGMQNAGLQRQFSLQDYATQYANALNLANAAKTQGPTGKASPGTQAGIGTALAVGNTAATMYGAAHPTGKAA